MIMMLIKTWKVVHIVPDVCIYICIYIYHIRLLGNCDSIVDQLKCLDILNPENIFGYMPSTVAAFFTGDHWGVFFVSNQLGIVQPAGGNIISKPWYGILKLSNGGASLGVCHRTLSSK